MSRRIKIAAAQVGAVNKDASRQETLARLLSLLDQAHNQGVQLLVYPELTFTTFFPRHLLTTEQLEPFLETSGITTSPNTRPLFDKASTYKIDLVVGYAERTPEGKVYNTCVYYSAARKGIVSKYRKIHLPGTTEPFADPDATNQLEKRYFTPGDLGFRAFRALGLVPSPLTLSFSTETPKGPVTSKQDQGKGDAILGMLICNDRRWPEAWRALALQGAEIVACGYNTGANMPALWGEGAEALSAEEAEERALFHNRLVQQGNSYMNSCFSVSAARCGVDDGVERFKLIAGSAIVDPLGRVVAEAKTQGDELVVAKVDLAECAVGRAKTFDFERHRRVEAYGLIGTQTGVVEPELLG